MFIRRLAISNSSIWVIHLKAKNVINREIDQVANLWQILCEEKQIYVIKLDVALVENLNFFLQLL